MEIANPNELYKQLCENASKRKQNTLHLINELCIEQSKNPTKDFSISTIGRLSQKNGGPTEQALRNKNGADYRALIGAWAQFCNTTTKKPLKNHNTTLTDSILSNISDPTTKALVGMVISENKSLKREISLLKEATVLDVDLRYQPQERAKDDVVEILSISLTDMELSALQHAISDEFIVSQGWKSDEYGRIKKQNMQIYKPGYITAIKKILDYLS